MRKSFRGSLRGKLLTMTVLPMLALACLILIGSIVLINHSLRLREQKELEKNARLVAEKLDELYPGDYRLVGTEALYVYKGEHILSDDRELLDSLKLFEDFELTFFYQDTRILTTLCDERGERFIGTGASSLVQRDVLETGEAKCYSKVDVNGERYQVYYLPLLQKDGSVAGMIGAACPVESGFISIAGYILPLSILCIAAILFAAWISVGYTQKLVGQIGQLKSFMNSVAKGNLSVDLGEKILKQQDEIGELGRIGLEMKSSLRRMVELDELTQINNRRYGQKRVELVRQRAGETGVNCCVAIADIDFFKRVNDTYGHEAGDAVLRAVAATIKEGMRGNGFVARWGGEEFLIVFEHHELVQAVAELEKLRLAVEVMQTEFEEVVIPVTMSIGVAVLSRHENTDESIKRADECLYRAKEGGRNQVVDESHSVRKKERGQDAKNGV